MKKGKPLLIFFLLIWLVSQQPVTGVVDEKSNVSPSQRHPEAILALFGSWCTLGQFFGLPAAYALGRNPSLLEALSNTRADGIGALYREGTASFLNSLVSRSFVFTPRQVRDAFNAAVLSNSAAGAQAELFKKANEGHLVKHH
ncbi:hypothetical protein BHE74_00002492 [Ensete ventricosum]|uniref:Uncharacterized protein n=1 Tax=Ensete ventricosum TaxID=4639 RepID=A0A426Y8E2_ENSVE|nr:hypothetical protein B296_00017506 [Ensete ventricosum]RWV78798.1 hypothetical protein GW17_00060174 [Ensete ventricosum]RWW88638.1 hypothetical protein BHE74_00002492 [Ensete ventricosum]RZS09637.1 hypothetical protein BHM03_00040746 [Ensete ventricosum]